MTEPAKQGRDLLLDIQSDPAITPTLWWLGHSGFALKFRGIVFYIDPCLGEIRGRERMLRAPLRPDEISNADLVLCTNARPGHMNPATLPGILAASPRCRVVLPRSAAGQAFVAGVPYERMTSTDADLRVEYVRDDLRAVIYSLPGDAIRGRDESGLGYVMRFDGFTIYHAGDSWPLVERVRPYRPSVALLPIGLGGQLAEEFGARWLVPMHYGTFAGQEPDADRFIDHMLGQRPALPFKVFDAGEKWRVPVEAAIL